MTVQKNTYTQNLYFNCPHCNSPIEFAVEAGEPLEVGDWYDGEDSPIPSYTEYYDTMSLMQQAIAVENYDEAVTFICQSIDQLADASTESNLHHFPILKTGGMVLALKGKVVELERMSEVVRTTPALKLYAGVVDKHFEDLKMFEDIRQAVIANPGCLQSEVKNLISVVDGRKVATLIGWLDKHGDIVRKRQGNKIFLYPADSDTVVE